MLQMMDRYIEHGVSLGFETTLSGRSYIRSIMECQARGYWVTLLFLSLPTPEHASGARGWS